MKFIQKQRNLLKAHTDVVNNNELLNAPAEFLNRES